MVVALEGVVGREVALEQAGGGRDAGDDADAALLGELQELGAGRLLDRLLARPERGGRAVRKLALAARLVGGGSWRRTVTLRDATAEPVRLRAALGARGWTVNGRGSLTRVLADDEDGWVPVRRSAAPQL